MMTKSANYDAAQLFHLALARTLKCFSLSLSLSRIAFLLHWALWIACSACLPSRSPVWSIVSVSVCVLDPTGAPNWTLIFHELSQTMTSLTHTHICARTLLLVPSVLVVVVVVVLILSSTVRRRGLVAAAATELHCFTQLATLFCVLPLC